MAQPTPDMAAHDALEGQIRECFGRVVYSHKTQEKQGDLCAATLRRFKIAQIALAAVTTSGTLAILFTDDFGLKLITALVSLITLFVSGYMKGFDPGAAAQKHRDTAADLWAIRESYLSLLTDFVGGAIGEVLARERRDTLQGALAAIYKSAPGTTPKAYLRANRKLIVDPEADIAANFPLSQSGHTFRIPLGTPVPWALVRIVQQLATGKSRLIVIVVKLGLIEGRSAAIL